MEIGKLFNGRLDLDNSIASIKEGDYSYMLDGIIGKSYDGNKGNVENMMGTSSLTSTSDMSGGFCIGGCRDPKSNAYYLFFRNTDPAKHTIVKVLNNSVTKIMTWSGLNFQIGYRVQSVFINGYLYFTDNYNGLRGFNVNDYLSSAPTSEEDIALIKRGAIYAPTCVKITDTEKPINLIEKKDFQFTYVYVYNDNQVSVVAPYSKLVSRNNEGESFNKIRVTVSTNESIPDNVKEIRFAVRVGNSGSFQFIGTLERSVDNFATNYIDFFNTIYGGAVQTDYLNLYHDVPLKAKSIEFIKNRLWVANLLEGYDVPASPNMEVTTSAIESVAVGLPIYTEGVAIYSITRYEYMSTSDGKRLDYTGTTTNYGGIRVTDPSLISIDRGVGGKSLTAVTTPAVGYEIDDPAYSIIDLGLPSYVTSTWTDHLGGSGKIIPFGSLTDIILPPAGPTLSFSTAYYVYRYEFLEYATLITYVTDSPSAYDGSSTFPNGSQYAVGLVYKDRYGRSSSVVIGNSDINTSSSVYSNVITAGWVLPSGANLSIPDWAESYHIVRTRNLTKSIFFEWKTAQVKYIKEADSGDTFSNTYSADYTGVYIDIAPMTNVGLGYSWKEGDRIVLYKPDGSNTYNMQIRRFESGKIYLDNKSIGTISSQNIYFEIYRPNVITEDLLFYEIGQGYPITDAGLSTRSFSVTSGEIAGDSFNKMLNTYTYSGSAYALGTDGLFKEMSIDVTSSDWNTDIGKPHVESTIGQKQRPYTFKHSAPIINDTQINGLSEFYSSDQKDVPYENGEIFKLKSANRTASDGTVLLAICRNRVASIYVDESRLNINAQVNYLVSGSEVIGEVNTLSGWFGTVHPESVFDDGTFVYWYCKPRRSFVRYGNNGMFPISTYNAISYFEEVSLSHDEDDVVIGGYHPFYDLALSQFPNADTGKKTIGYEVLKDAWRGFYSIAGDYFFDIADIFYSVSGGVIYRHNNSAAFGTIYGTLKPTIIETPINARPDMPKIWQTAVLYPSPNFVEWYQGDQRIKTTSDSDLSVTLYNEEGQTTDVLRDEFEVGEYVVFAPLKKDANSPLGVSDGDDMTSCTSFLRIEFSGNENRYISEAKVGFISSKGFNL